MATIINNPNETLNPVRGCMQVDFESETLMGESGTKAMLLIPASEFDNVAEGTTVDINGVVFTFVDGANDDTKNEVSTSGTRHSNLFFVANENYELRRNILFSPNGGLNILPLVCNLDIIVIFNNLDGNQPTKQFTATGTPLVIAPNFAVKVGLRRTDAPTYDVPIDLSIFANTALTDDKCQVESYTIDHNLARDLEGQVTTNLPTLNVLPSPIHQEKTEMTAIMTGHFAESYGEPVNIFKRSSFPNFKIYDGAIDMSDYTDLAAKKLISPYAFEDKISPKTLNWVYYYLGGETNIEVKVQLYDKSGSPFLAQVRRLNQDVTGDIVEVAVDFPRLMVGFNAADYSAYEVQINDSEPLRFTFDHSMCGLNICFKSRLGGFHGVSTLEPTSRSYELTQDIIKICKPCKINCYEVQRKEIEEQITVFIQRRNHSKSFLDDLYSSTEMYWIDEGNFYPIVLTTNSIPNYQLNQDIELPLSFKFLT